MRRISLILFIVALTISCSREMDYCDKNHPCMTVIEDDFIIMNFTAFYPSHEWNNTGDIIYAPNLGFKENKSVTLYKCDTLIFDFSNEDSLISFKVYDYDDGALIDSTANYGSRSFKFLESGVYKLQAVYANDDFPSPFNADTSIISIKIDFLECQ